MQILVNCRCRSPRWIPWYWPRWAAYRYNLVKRLYPIHGCVKLHESLDRTLRHFNWPADRARRTRHRPPKHQVPQPVCQEVAPEGGGAGLAEAEVAAGLEEHCHLGIKAHLEKKVSTWLWVGELFTLQVHCLLYSSRRAFGELVMDLDRLRPMGVDMVASDEGKNSPLSASWWTSLGRPLAALREPATTELLPERGWRARAPPRGAAVPTLGGGLEGVDCGADGAVGREVGGGRVGRAAAALGGRGMETWEASLKKRIRWTGWRKGHDGCRYLGREMGHSPPVLASTLVARQYLKVANDQWILKYLKLENIQICSAQGKFALKMTSFSLCTDMPWKALTTRWTRTALLPASLKF